MIVWIGVVVLIVAVLVVKYIGRISDTSPKDPTFRSMETHLWAQGGFVHGPRVAPGRASVPMNTKVEPKNDPSVTEHVPQSADQSLTKNAGDRVVRRFPEDATRVRRQRTGS